MCNPHRRYRYCRSRQGHTGSQSMVNYCACQMGHHEGSSLVSSALTTNRSDFSFHCSLLCEKMRFIIITVGTSITSDMSRRKYYSDWTSCELQCHSRTPHPPSSWLPSWDPARCRPDHMFCASSPGVYGLAVAFITTLGNVLSFQVKNRSKTRVVC